MFPTFSIFPLHLQNCIGEGPETLLQLEIGEDSVENDIFNIRKDPNKNTTQHMKKMEPGVRVPPQEEAT